MITYPSAAGDMTWVTQDWFTDDDERSMLADARPAARARLRRNLRNLRARETTWNDTVTAAQAGIGWGDFWVCDPAAAAAAMTQLPGETQALSLQAVWAWGYVLPLTDVIDGEMAACTRRGMTEAAALEAAQDRCDRVRAGYARGWRHCMTFSPVIPGGEIEDVHVATIGPATMAGFAAARGRGWRPPPLEEAAAYALARYADSTLTETMGRYEDEMAARFDAAIRARRMPACPHASTEPQLRWFPVDGCPLGCGVCVAAWMIVHVPPGSDANTACDICGTGPHADGTYSQRQLIRVCAAAGGSPEQAVTITYLVCDPCLAAEAAP